MTTMLPISFMFILVRHLCLHVMNFHPRRMLTSSKNWREHVSFNSIDLNFPVGAQCGSVICRSKLRWMIPSLVSILIPKNFDSVCASEKAVLSRFLGYFLRMNRPNWLKFGPASEWLPNKVAAIVSRYRIILHQNAEFVAQNWSFQLLKFPSKEAKYGLNWLGKTLCMQKVALVLKCSSEKSNRLEKYFGLET